jgi:hypothetical protein
LQLWQKQKGICVSIMVLKVGDVVIIKDGQAWLTPL